MMKKTTIYRMALIVSATVGLLACGEQEIPEPHPPTTISFDPPIEVFEGKPGDVLELKVNVEGSLGFNNLSLIKTVDGVEAEEAVLVASGEGSYETPFSLDFDYTLREAEIGREVKLTFMAEVIARTPSGGTAYAYPTEFVEIATRGD